jgi:hypothetical protein
MLKHPNKSTTNARLPALGPKPPKLPKPPNRATSMLAAAKVAPRPKATTTIQNRMALGVGPLTTLEANQAARVAPPRHPTATTLLAANRAARLALQRQAATNLKAGVGPLPTLVSNRAARVAPPRPPAAATLLAANRAARVRVQLPTTPRPHLPCATLQSLQKSL